MTKRDELFPCEKRVAAWSLGAEQVKTPPVVGPGECNKEPSGLLTAVPELACGLEQGGAQRLMAHLFFSMGPSQDAKL